MSKHYKMSLADDAAQKAEQLVAILGGNVQRFAASIVEDVVELPVDEIVRLRREIKERVHDYKTAQAMAKKRENPAA